MSIWTPGWDIILSKATNVLILSMHTYVSSISLNFIRCLVKLYLCTRIIKRRNIFHNLEITLNCELKLITILFISKQITFYFASNKMSAIHRGCRHYSKALYIELANFPDIQRVVIPPTLTKYQN